MLSFFAVEFLKVFCRLQFKEKQKKIELFFFIDFFYIY